MLNVKINTVDMEEVHKLERWIDGKMYAVISQEPRGLQIAVVIPYGTRRGLTLFCKVVKQFVRSAWGHTR